MRGHGCLDGRHVGRGRGGGEEGGWGAEPAPGASVAGQVQFRQRGAALQGEDLQKKDRLFAVFAYLFEWMEIAGKYYIVQEWSM